MTLPSATLLTLLLGYARHESHPHEHLVTNASDACTSRLGHAVGGEFMTCVVDELLAVQSAAKEEGSQAFFPVVPHSVDPWSPLVHSPGAERSDLLKDLLRNYSCDFEDGGSQPLRSMTWEYKPPDPCGSVDAKKPPEPYVYKGGFLPAGNDLPALAGTYTEAEAQAVCLAEDTCAGFTFNSPTRSKAQKHTIHFKSSADGVSLAADWHTYKRRSRGVDCRPGKRKPPPTTLRLQVDVLRESPPVYIVHDFATEAECEYMMNLTIPNMAPSVVYGGGQAGQASSYRQSFSVNMYPDCAAPTHALS